MTRRVLIVDDEVHIRSGLRLILRMLDTSFHDVDDAEDGQSALSHLAATPTDLVIADIRMPNMDGLTLLQRSHELPRMPYFIFLTGFDDFRYAKHALRFGATDYLLKPVDTEELKAALLRVEQAMEHEDKLRGELTERDDKLRQKSAYELGFIMTSDGLPADEVESALRCGGLEPYFSGAFETAVLRFHTSSAHSRSHVLPAAWTSLMLSEVFGDDAGRFISFVDGEGRAVIAGPPDRFDEQRLDALCRSLRTGTIQVGCSGPVEGGRRVRDSYKRACEALRYRVIAHRQRVIRYPDLPVMATCPDVPSDEIRLIAALIGSNRIQEIKERLLQLFELEALRHYPIRYTDLLVAELYDQVVDCWKRRFPACEQLEDRAYSILRSVDSFVSVNDYLSHLVGFIIEVDTYIMALRGTYRESGAMDAAVLWLSENYADSNLTMARVAEHFGLNYTYFSTAFREHVGMSFVHYLKKIRADRAAELMGTSGLRLKEIGPRVGLPSARLFTRAFKETYGLSPGSYRRGREGGLAR